MKIISEDSEEPIEISKEHELFGYVALSLLEQGIGAVTCIACNRNYNGNQLKSVTLGAGKSPFDVNLKPKGDIQDLFPDGERRNRAMIDRKGDCVTIHNVR